MDGSNDAFASCDKYAAVAAVLAAPILDFASYLLLVTMRKRGGKKT